MRLSSGESFDCGSAPNACSIVTSTFANEPIVVSTPISFDPDVPPPFGFKRNGRWLWWDNTTTEESILDGADAIDYLREYLDRLFPSMTITVTDQR